MANELTEGTRRVGSLVDFNPDTPEVTVTLENSERGIGVTVPWTGPDSPYSGWFMSQGGFGGPDDGNPPRAPRRLLFADSHGSVLLVGCWARGFHSAWHGPGNGHVWAKAAIMGVDSDVDYERPHGVQTEITGLREWLNVSSWDDTHSWGSGGAEVALTSIRRPVIEVGVSSGSGLKLELRPGYQVTHQDSRDRIVLADYVRCTTVGVDPRPWSDHLQSHMAIRDLLMLSRWHVERFRIVKATREDDRLLTLDGKDHGRQWRTVVEPSTAPVEAAGAQQRHLIEYDDIGPSGLARWIELRDEFGRALDPVITSRDFKNDRPHTVLAHTGPGLEALGYLLLVRDGKSPRDAAAASLRHRLDRIYEDVIGCVPFDGDLWASRFVSAYNGLKHANRVAPVEVDVMNVWREGVMAVRAWVALELGLNRAIVEDRLKYDPQRHPYVVTE